MKKIWLVLLLISIVVISGCIGRDVVARESIEKVTSTPTETKTTTSSENDITIPAETDTKIESKDDIEIADILYRNTILPDEPISIEVNIINYFDNNIPEIKIESLIINPDGESIGSNEKLITLAPLDTTTVTIPLGALPCNGLYTIQTKLDPLNAITEIGEENNVYNITIDVTGDKECYCNTECNDNNQRTFDTCTNNICEHLETLEPRGEIKVLVFETKPSDFYDRDAIIPYFNSENGTSDKPTIYDIKSWYESQADIYGITDFSINIEVVGPFIINRFEYGFDQDAEAIADFYNNKLIEMGYEREDYDIVHYVYFDDLSINPNTTDFGFRSFGSRYEGDTFNDVIIPIEGIKVIIHEMGHTFNGDDLYTLEGPPCQIPDGIPEPDKNPLYPQTKACLMCGSIITSESSYASINSLEEVVICDYTAEKFWWK